MNHRRDGILTPEEIEGQTPPADRAAKGPVVVVECVERIPCNPCVDACPRGAITIDGDINDIPSVDHERCNGCGLCISACPGLAIFVIDASAAGESGAVMLPYEYRPLPREGEIVTALDRGGEPVCDARVTRVLSSKALDRTPIVTIEIPKSRIMEVRHFRRKDPSR